MCVWGKMWKGEEEEVGGGGAERRVSCLFGDSKIFFKGGSQRFEEKEGETRTEKDGKSF